jgi:predicted metal-dependent hydrolase
MAPILPEPDTLRVVIVRSARRKRTVGARLLDDHTLQIQAPADLSDDQLRPIIDGLRTRAARRLASARSSPSDHALQTRAQRLNRDLFKGSLRWKSIRFVDDQLKRFGSCTPETGAIRISRRLASVPPFVLDYVIVHELAHLKHPNHSAAFWAAVNRYRYTERARGYLIALQLEGDSVLAPGADDGEESDR